MAADDEGVELIVISMRRAGATGHLLHEAAERYILRHSAVPVVIVPHGSMPGTGTVPAAA